VDKEQIDDGKDPFSDRLTLCLRRGVLDGGTKRFKEANKDEEAS